MDASVACNDDFSLQTGYSVCFCDDKNGCHIFDFASKTSHRVAHSVMERELYAITDAFDAGFALNSTFSTNLDRRSHYAC